MWNVPGFFAHLKSSIQCHFAWVGPVSHMFVTGVRCYHMPLDFVCTHWKSLCKLCTCTLWMHLKTFCHLANSCEYNISWVLSHIGNPWHTWSHNPSWCNSILYNISVSSPGHIWQVYRHKSYMAGPPEIREHVRNLFVQIYTQCMYECLCTSSTSDMISHLYKCVVQHLRKMSSYEFTCCTFVCHIISRCCRADMLHI